MVGKVMELQNVLEPDQKAVRITERYMEWDLLRQVKKNDWEEIRRYRYATDTTQTTNNTTPWKNKTTVPKLCQIGDNLYANYIATAFPKRKGMYWEANNHDDNSKAKRDAIVNYMTWVKEQPMYKHEMDKIILDYLDFGNCFGTVEWVDQRVQTKGKTQMGYVGPMIRRISPLDMIMNPTAENFVQSPKIVRSIVSMGELRDMLERLTNDENRETNQNLYEYLKKIRFHARTFQGDWIQRDRLYAVDGFTSFRAYILSEFVEVLTFYGDYHDYINDTFHKNRVITVVDRHKLINDQPNPSFYGYPPIFHLPWRKKQDNLWGMGPFDNLVGMQYRMDHLENMGADIFDFTAYPVQLIKGFVEDFIWQPAEKIFTSEEGSVEIVQPKVEVLNADMKIEKLERLMEEMAGAPREAMGFRTPGEKTKYEVQRQENAGSRLFQNKIGQFEEQMVEPLDNAMLELAQRNLSGTQVIRVMDNESNTAFFQELTVEDITGIGRIKSVGARHFAEQAELVQNLTNLSQGPMWQFVQPHFSSIKLAKIYEEVFDLKDYEVVQQNVAIAEQADAQRTAQTLHEQLQMEQGTATGMGQDYDMQHSPGGPPPPMPQPPQKGR
jgi:hypothetical protein